MNDVVVMVERNRRNNRTANFLHDQRPVQKSELRFAVGIYIQLNAFFRRAEGHEKKYDLTGIRIGIGLKQRSGLRD